ncbi:MAG: endonuclease/exonuclease/phosphatase family protein [Microbacteriaceae bacterium]|jgi:exodeoxyribonuclease-3|nr:endonuclease/exonuclease/phosphatase family protein [Microbacteriaceae bacterium]
MPPAVTLISYNLWQSRGQRELPSLVSEHQPDLLCLQETASFSLPARIGGLRLAATTKSNPFRVALYVREDRFDIVAARSFRLWRSVHDRLLHYTGERLAAAHLHDRLADRDLVVGSLHATPLTDPNVSRLRQVWDAHTHLRGFGAGLPIVMAGDFNFPVLSSVLRVAVAMQGFRLARSETGTYQHFTRSYLRGSFDLATTAGLVVDEIVTLPQRASDHKPILMTFRYSGALRAAERHG